MSFLVTHTPHISASVLTTGGLTGPNLMNGGYGSFLEDDGGATADKVHMQAVATGGTVYVYDFSVTTKQLTLAGSYTMPISSGSNANSVHLASNNFFLSWRTSSLTAFCRGEEQDDTGYGDVTSDVTEGSEHYVNAFGGDGWHRLRLRLLCHDQATHAGRFLHHADQQWIEREFRPPR